jgi:phytoene dehydrogenase-like protein
VDWALDAPIPWARAQCGQAATVHIGGTLEEIESSESAVWNGEHPERPFIILAQQSLFDGTRAPPGKHTAWAYCRVPNGSTVDMTDRIESQIERFAPRFREVVLRRSVTAPADLERHNENYVGGDISGGVHDLRQLFARPSLRRVPYATALPDVYLCSSSTPPGAGVHGMCGHFAALAALRGESDSNRLGR